MNRTRLGLVVLGVTLLAGCVTDPGYAPMDAAKGQYFGYVDQPNGDGGHTIRVVLPQVAQDPRSAFATSGLRERLPDFCPLPPRKDLGLIERGGRTAVYRELIKETDLMER